MAKNERNGFRAVLARADPVCELSYSHHRLSALDTSLFMAIAKRSRAEKKATGEDSSDLVPDLQPKAGTVDLSVWRGALSAPPLEGWCLASMRQSKGISLEQISNMTKLRVSTLKAIEDANFDVLPGGFTTSATSGNTPGRLTLTKATCYSYTACSITFPEWLRRLP
jgi:hypothetical protein